jgi:hypothetical protein
VEVRGELDVDAEEGHVEDLQASAHAEKGDDGVLDLDGKGHPAVEREARIVERQSRANGGALSGVPVSGRGHARAELEVQSQRAGHEVAADEVDGGLEAVVDAEGGALPAAGGVDVERRLEREPEGPLCLGPGGGQQQPEAGEPEQERKPHRGVEASR